MSVDKAEPKKMWLTWVLANGFGLTLGGVLHAFIGHGITGGHDFWLTPLQFIMHTIGFFVLGSTVALAQRSAVHPFVRLSYRGALVKGALVMAGFWAGYYTGGIPVDIICGFATLGVVSGVELRGKVPHWRGWMMASSLGFTLASGVVIAAALPVYKVLLSAFGGGLFGDATLWAYIGIVGGPAGGLLTAPFLVKSLQPGAGAVDEPSGTIRA
jgi:hypothetical protein